MDLDSGEEFGFRVQSPCRRVRETYYKGGVLEDVIADLCTRLSWAGFADIGFEIDNTPDRKGGKLPTFTVTAFRWICACHTLPPATPVPQVAEHQQVRPKKARRPAKKATPRTKQKPAPGKKDSGSAGADHAAGATG